MLQIPYHRLILADAETEQAIKVEVNAIPKLFTGHRPLKSKIFYTRGRNGGYRLDEPPEKITLVRVIRIVDGPIALLSCTSLYFSNPATIVMKNLRHQPCDGGSKGCDFQGTGKKNLA